VVAHGVVGVLIAGMLAATGKPPRPVADPPQETVLEISLVADSLPLSAETTRPPVKAAPRTPPAPAKADDAPGGAPPPVDPKRKDAERPAPDAPSQTASTGDGGIVLGPSPFAGPARKGGLEGLASNDPCTARIGPKPKDCGTDWAGKLGSDPSVMARSKEELARYYAEFVPRCHLRVGCDGGEWVSNQGTRSVAGTKMAGGAAGLGGMNETVGRLGFNPDHVDPGFGD
jgi:hypothetical protein